MRKKLVLVVDDERVARAVVAALLPDEPDLTVAMVRTAEEAVRAIAELRPDLVLLDLGVPGLDGRGLAGRLRADPATAGAPLVALSPLAGALPAPAYARAVGCDAVVAAPSDGAGLLGALRRDRRATPSDARRAFRRPTRAELSRHTAALSARAAALADRSARLNRRAIEARDGLPALVRARPPVG